MQRYCDPDTPFYPLERDETFHGAFKRSSDFYNWITSSVASLFGSTLSSDVALIRRAGVLAGSRGGRLGFASWARDDLAAIRRLDEVSTNEMEKITQQLSHPQHAAGLHP